MPLDPLASHNPPDLPDPPRGLFHVFTTGVHILIVAFAIACLGVLALACWFALTTIRLLVSL